MYSLLSKIFFAYWIAASLVIVIASFEPHSLIHTPELTGCAECIFGEKCR